jgi:hypothetical protein
LPDVPIDAFRTWQVETFDRPTRGVFDAFEFGSRADEAAA